MSGLALLLVGYSLFAAVVLALTHFGAQQYAEHKFSRWMGLSLLLVLGYIQLSHFAWLYADHAWINSYFYRAALFAVAPLFYLFSLPLLTQSPPLAGLRMLLHAQPLLVSWVIPAAIALPCAFLVGAGYLVWLGRQLFALRAQRSRFQVEMLLLGGVFIVAVSVSLLGFWQAFLPEKLFFSLYASAIGIAFLAVQLALGLRPNLTVEVTESVQASSYVTSSLNNVDCEAALTSLTRAMQQEQIYTRADLSLPVLARHLGLSTHQLSELLNNRMGKSFSRFLREERVHAAKVMLLAQPAASVLSVGLSVGFTSQSTFYDAFREIEGMTPGQFRKLHGKAG
jgi:AraC-like DNA-binding protein